MSMEVLNNSKFQLLSTEVSSNKLNSKDFLNNIDYSSKTNNSTEQQHSFSAPSSSCSAELRSNLVRNNNNNSAWLELNWCKIRKSGNGLLNLGNNCYLNATLQCLAYTPPLSQWLVLRQHSPLCKYKQAKGFCSLCEVERIIYDIFNSTGFAKPNNLCFNIKKISNVFGIGTQEDASEFFTTLLESMAKSIKFSLSVEQKQLSNLASACNNKKISTILDDIFSFQFRSRITCCNCGLLSDTIENTNTWPVDVKYVQDIRKGMMHFLREEILEGENSYKCDRCNKKVKATKKYSIRTAPNILVIHLKRFDFTCAGKLSHFVSYPEILGLKQFITESDTESTLRNTSYKLYGVLVHLGFTSHSGHYYSYVRGPNEVWYKADDQHVSIVHENESLSQNAYILFYSKISSNFATPSLLNETLSKEDLKSNLTLKTQSLKQININPNKCIPLSKCNDLTSSLEKFKSTFKSVDENSKEETNKSLISSDDFKRMNLLLESTSKIIKQEVSTNSVANAAASNASLPSITAMSKCTNNKNNDQTKSLSDEQVNQIKKLNKKKLKLLNKQNKLKSLKLKKKNHKIKMEHKEYTKTKKKIRKLKKVVKKQKRKIKELENHSNSFEVINKKRKLDSDYDSSSSSSYSSSSSSVSSGKQKKNEHNSTASNSLSILKQYESGSSASSSLSSSRASSPSKSSSSSSSSSSKSSSLSPPKNIDKTETLCNNDTKINLSNLEEKLNSTNKPVDVNVVHSKENYEKNDKSKITNEQLLSSNSESNKTKSNKKDFENNTNNNNKYYYSNNNNNNNNYKYCNNVSSSFSSNASWKGYKYKYSHKHNYNNNQSHNSFYQNDYNNSFRYKPYYNSRY